jgi:ATP-dependent RNA helicase DDX41
MEDYAEYVPLAQRKLAASRKRLRTADAPADAPTASSSSSASASASSSLVDQARHAQEAAAAAAAAAGQVLRGAAEAPVDERRALEADLLAQVMRVQKHALSSAREHADGTRYTASLRTDWRPPRHVAALSEAERAALREKWHIVVEGEDVPPPCRTFAEMRLPAPVLDGLAAKGIERPTPIQVQGLPVAFSGRDMIGIAFTGSGKSLAFCLPMLLFSLQEEARMPLARGEGPVGIVLAPSRELARQHAETIEHFAGFLTRSGRFPELRTMLAIGGEDLRTQLAPVEKGVHMIVATPGRLFDHLSKRRVALDICRLFVLDEGDRMLDMDMGEDIKNIISFFTHQRQTVIFSATMPKTIEDFARESLVRPVVVNVSRAGAANLDVIQEVEYVKQEAKIVYLLQCLQKTAPPALIFAENKRDVDEIHEYLLLKGVGAVSVHGDKSQEERNEAIRAFKDAKKDVLVATDVAAKGLDFPEIQHVINFDMPKEVETYVHRIGRTGRAGKTGVATTFINKSVDERLLLDLKHLLMEAKQRVPPALLALEDPAEQLRAAATAARGPGDAESSEACVYCGGLGHRITECPRLERERQKLSGITKDSLGGRGGDW